MKKAINIISGIAVIGGLLIILCAADMSDREAITTAGALLVDLIGGVLMLAGYQGLKIGGCEYVEI